MVAIALIMNKTQLQAKLFLFYLRFRKPIIALSIIAATTIIGLDSWLRFKEGNIDSTPWTVTKVNSGSSLIVIRHDKTKMVNLCGVKPIGDETKQYLTLVINLGDGTLELEQVENNYESWVSLKPGYDVELVKHVSNTPDELVEQEIHLNTWLIERGMARKDAKEAAGCREPEHLAWAETVAKEGKFGIWQNK